MGIDKVLNTRGTAPGIAVITGASSGIGAVYADRLARRGHDLILDRTQSRTPRCAGDRLRRGTGHSVEVVAGRSEPARRISPASNRCCGRTPRITVLVNNAGVAMSGDLSSADPDRLESMIQLNVLAPSRLALAALPGFIARGRGTLINISSVLALAPERFNGSYSGTKAYLLNLSPRLQQEVASKGVRVQVVLPGRPGRRSGRRPARRVGVPAARHRHGRGRHGRRRAWRDWTAGRSSRFRRSRISRSGRRTRRRDTR